MATAIVPSNCMFLVLAVLLALSLPSTPMARPLAPTSSATLLGRLKLDDESGSSECWASLLELQSCSAEIVMFFLNGETFLGPECCDAIRIIIHHCWPAMIGSLGYTDEETDVLEGYCDAVARPFSPDPLLQPNNN